MGKGQSFQQMVLGQLVIPLKNNEPTHLPNTHLQKSTQNEL